MIPAIILLVLELPKWASWFITCAALFFTLAIVALIAEISTADFSFTHYLIAFGVGALTSIGYNIGTGIVVDDDLWPAVARIGQEVFTLGVMLLLLFFA